MRSKKESKKVDSDMKDSDAVKFMVQDILQEIVIPEFSDYKIPFSKKEQEKMASSLFGLLKKRFILNNKIRTYSVFYHDVADEIIENYIEEYLYKHKRMIPAKNSKERLYSGVRPSEQEIIFGTAFYDDFEDPIINILKKRWEAYTRSNS